MKILMCRPDYFGIKYEINPWMDISKQADHELAVKQWEQLQVTLTQCGADVLFVPPQTECPDMTFTANAGLLYQGEVILSHFKYPERQTEAPYFESWFTHAGFDVANPVKEHSKTPYFEGAGDALPAGNLLFAGYGFRTDATFYKRSPLFSSKELILCELVNPYFYHLDTCFCPLTDNLALWFAPAFSAESQARMRDAIELIDVEPDEAQKFACNAVVIGEHVIIPSGCEKLSGALTKRGFKVHACDMSEYMKAGGACKCLTLRLD